jgi:hypothetical protein
MVTNYIRNINVKSIYIENGYNPGGVDNFGYSPIQRAVTVLYTEQTVEIYCLIFELSASDIHRVIS